MVGRKTFRFPEACLAVEALIPQRGKAHSRQDKTAGENS
jgi:hypothetical protein